MQFRYVFSELRSGLRRNLSMHIAVVLTLFVSMTLLGLGVLMKQQSDIATRFLGDQLQVTVYLCRDGDTNPACAARATDEQKQRVVEAMEGNPEVASYTFESQEEAFEKVKELYGADQFDGDNPALTAADMPESYWITLKDPKEFQGIESEVQGLDGVSQIRDVHETLKPIYEWLDALKYGSWGIAVFLLVAALLLVANTIRLAAFARRKEIAIMRLVGASTLYIALPFLMEAVVTAVIGVALAGGTLGAFMWFGVHERIADSVKFMPWIGAQEYTTALVVIAILGPALTLLPTLLLTRKYLKV
ncbi:permease-like cell division protein FtsX [Nocardioides halotolerans]|jgi:cell division transport system permease protein|uniref:permease-like cell division protein FtsX n=1 Tax=Nocardioides halotolerans TaxID=433660 RepID=UPI00042360E3|nr:permease-like cell division protein FtsX [Nocardioides halotolerans]